MRSLIRIGSRLDRSIVRELSGPLALGLAGFSLVLLLNYIFLLIRQTIERGLSLSVFWGFAWAELPRIVMFALPMAVLLGVLVGIGRMSTQNEILALRTATVAPARVFVPVLACSFVLAGVGLLCAHFLMPLGRRHEQSLVREIIRVQDLNREIDPGVFYDRLPGAVLYARRAAESSQGRIFEGIVLHRDAPDGRSVDLLLARRGRAVFDRESGQRTLLLDEGEWHILRPQSPESYNVVRFEHYSLPFPPDVAFASLANDSGADDPHEAAGAELPRLLRSLARRRAEARDRSAEYALTARLRYAGLEWHRRWALPAASIVLALVGFPLAARSRSGGRFAGLSQALAIIFVFWLVLSTGWGLSEQGKWPPWLGPWAPNLVAAVWAGWLWFRLFSTEEKPPLWSRVWGAVLAGLRSVRGLRAATVRGGEPGAASAVVGGPDRRRRIGRLDAFLAAGYLRMFGAVLFVLVVLALAIGFKGAIDEVDPQAAHFPWRAILRYLCLSTPGHLRYIVPIAALFGAAISLSALARTGEIVALKAAGVSPVRIVLPLLLATVGIAALYGAFQESFLPAAQRESQHALDRVRGRSAGPEVLETGRRWLVGEPQHIWNYLDWDGPRGALLAPALLVVDFDNARVLERIEAHDARSAPSGWLFRSGWRRVFQPVGPPLFERITERLVPLAESPELFGATRSRFVLGQALADQKTFLELWRDLRRISRTGYDSSALAVGLHEKLVFPLLPLCLLLLGAPLAVSGWRRKGSLFGFGVAILVVFGFWAAWAVTTSLGREGVLSPALATWVPPLALAGAGLWRLARAR